VSAAHPLRAFSHRVAGWLAPESRQRPPRSRADLVGRDFAHPRARRRFVTGALLAAIGGVLLAALAIAALRVDLIRVRYGLGEAMKEEKALLEQERTLRAELGALRDPNRLARLAPRYGLARPVRVLELEGRPAPAARP
jgi:hypothetical protein